MVYRYLNSVASIEVLRIPSALLLRLLTKGLGVPIQCRDKTGTDSKKGSDAKFITGPCAFGLSRISDQAASTAFHRSGMVAERTPNLSVLN